MMFTYHDSRINKTRLKQGMCRCSSEGTTYELSGYVIREKIVDPRDRRKLLSTAKIQTNLSEPLPIGAGIGKTFIYAVSKDLFIRIAPDGNRKQKGSVKHETLFHNADVLAAGEIWIKNGVVCDVNDLSGSYRTAGKLEVVPQFAKSVLAAFNKSSVPIEQALRDRLIGFSLQ